MRVAAESPMESVDQWDDFVSSRYEEGKEKEQFRNYRADANPGVTEFYRQNHARQTLDFVLAKKAEYGPRTKARMSIWEAMDFLNTLVDDSDPDTTVRQSSPGEGVVEGVAEDHSLEQDERRPQEDDPDADVLDPRNESCDTLQHG